MTSGKMPLAQRFLGVAEAGGRDHRRDHRRGRCGARQRPVTRATVRIGLLAVLGALPLVTLGLNASASATPTGGKIQIWSTQNGSAANPIILTDAIGDYGTATSEDKDGKVDENGNYEKIVLQQGSFTINAVALNRILSSAKPQANKSNCGAIFSGSGPVTLSGGAGAYAGIKGTITAVLIFVDISPKLANGKCSPNASPVAAYGTVTGSGHVSF